MSKLTYTLRLTNTHLKKATLNGAQLAKVLGPFLGFDYADLKNGEGAEFPAFWTDGSETVLKFYKPASKAEKRFSIRKLTSRAAAGEVLQIRAKPRRGARRTLQSQPALYLELLPSLPD